MQCCTDSELYSTPTDDSSASDTFTVDIAVVMPLRLNVAPTASFTATPNAGAPPLAVAFDANASTDSDGTIVSYAWDFGDGTTGTGVTANHTYATAGAFTAQLIVTDDSTASDTFTVDIAVNALNLPPKPTFNATPLTGAPPLTVQFDATLSNDPDGTIVSYAWDFGDGNTGTGVTVQHIYQNAGTFTAQLIVTDDSTASDTASVDIVVQDNNRPPVAQFTTDTLAGEAPVKIFFDATASVDTGGTIASYSWNFGDGGNGTGDTISYTYANGGIFFPQLVVTDDQGATDTISKVIFVQNPGDTASTELRFVDTLVCPGNTFTATIQMRSTNARFFKPGTSSILFSYNPAALQFSAYRSMNFDGSDLCIAGVASAWDPHSFDGNSIPGSFNITMVLNNEGQGCPEVNGVDWINIGQVEFTVLDPGADPNLVFDRVNTNFNVDQPNDGTITIGKGTFESLTGNILTCPNNADPVAAFTPNPTTGAAPLVVNFDASASNDSDGTIVSYAWNFGDGITGVGTTIAHTYLTDGTYTAQLIITDDLGGRDTATAEIVGKPWGQSGPSSKLYGKP